MTALRYLDICSGISAPTMAWRKHGWTCAGYSEIEKFPRAVLAERYGAVPADWDHRHRAGSNVVPLFGDFTRIEAHHVGPIDLLVGGTPCQDFSIAGLRAGLDGDRGNLSLEYIRLADRTRPRWLVWENVPGVLSADEGAAFQAILSGLARWIVPIPDGGWQNSGIVTAGPVDGAYGLAWRVLDAQHFGVPQRRRRVFVVGYTGDWRRAAAVLFERHSLSRDTPPRREARQDVASGTAYGISSDCIKRSGDGANDSAAERSGLGIVEDAAQALRARRPNAIAHCADIVPQAMSCKWSKGSSGPAGDEHHNLIAFTAKDHGADAGAISPTLRGGGHDGSHANGGVMPAIAFDTTQITHSLSAEGFDAGEDGAGRGTPLVPIAFPAFLSGTQVAATVDLAPAMQAENPTAVAFAIQERAVSENVNAGPQGAGYREGVGYTLEARHHVQAVAFSIADNANGFAWESDVAATLQARTQNASANQFNGIRQSWAVRRLTPTECERLQGFPDAHTDVTYRGKPAADGPRYKSLGNSWARVCGSWLGERIAMVDAIPAAAVDALPFEELDAA